jgi:Flp pilus assembly protein TadD
MPQQVKKTLIISIHFALAAGALLVFWQVRNFNFVGYDDDRYIFENQHVISGLTFDSIKWAFTAAGHIYFWHPLTWLSHILDWQLYGNNAGGHHITNLIFHIANILLLFIVLRQLTGKLWQSAFVAALFALHPLHVESVVWIYERKDVLSTFFWFLTIWAYLRYVKLPGVWRYLLVVAFLALGLLSKPMLVTLPFLLLLLDYWPLDRLSLKIDKAGKKHSLPYLLLEKVPLFVMVLVSCIIVFNNQKSIGAMGLMENHSLFVRLANTFISYMQYIIKMIWPSRLAVFYPYPLNVSVLYAVISAAVLLTVTILVLRFAKLHRYLVTGWFWYLGTLIPVIGIVQVGLQAYADHYTYIPYIGLFIMLAWGLPQLLSNWPQRKIALGAAMVIVLTTLGICAHKQTSYWKNSITLFSHALEVTQNNYIAYNNIGLAYGNLGRVSQAIEDFSQAIKIKPDYSEAHYNLGLAYFSLGRGTEAIEAYKQAIRLKPDYTLAYSNLGVAYSGQGRWPEAIETFKQAINIKPDSAEAHANLGYAYLAISDKNSATAEYNILKSLNSEMANKLLNQINK